MNLFFWHRVLIITAVLFCAGFAARQVAVGIHAGRAATTALGVASGLASVALAYYLRWLVRKQAGLARSGAGRRDKRR